jgi:Ca2+-binding EF-hand superfamily protein
LVLAVACMVGLLPISASGAESQDGGSRPVKAQGLFKKLDKSKDGKLSKEEFLAGRTDLDRAKSQFGKADKSRDGHLSLDEFKAHLKRMADRAAQKEAEKNSENDSEKNPVKRW